ncbi:MAG: hypothetical protein SWZ49_23555 [Cyanobacteriota bacterium]|nr:hypothetical protein [Cyanobacteriota bacterium]
MINLLIFILKNAERKNKGSPAKEDLPVLPVPNKDVVLVTVPVKSS